MVKNKIVGRYLASLVVAVALGLFANSASAAVDPLLQLFYKPMVTQVPDRTKATIAVFRATEPVTVPPIVDLYGEVDPATGQTLLGMNVAFARPAYPFGDGVGKPHFWLVPAADDTVSAIEFNRKGREVEESGLNVSIDKKFEKYGHVEWVEPFPGSKKRTQIRGIVPDSIKSFKIITKRRGKKPLTKTHKVRNNAIILDLKNPSYIVLGGKKIKIHHDEPPGNFDGDFFK